MLHSTITIKHTFEKGKSKGKQLEKQGELARKARGNSWKSKGKQLEKQGEIAGKARGNSWKRKGKQLEKQGEIAVSLLSKFVNNGFWNRNKFFYSMGR